MNNDRSSIPFKKIKTDLGAWTRLKNNSLYIIFFTEKKKKKPPSDDRTRVQK